MVRAWNKQRKFSLKGRRAQLNKRYLPPVFGTNMWYSKDSVMGYRMAKGIYWCNRHMPKVIIDNEPIYLFRG